MSHSDSFSVTLNETRVFPVPAAFASQASLNADEYAKRMEIGEKDPEGYWAEAARELHWQKPFKRVLEWNAPFAKWFSDGVLNASENCIDRHLPKSAAKTAILWEGEPLKGATPETVRWTYSDLHDRTVRLTAALRKLGLKKGDRVAIYMPLVPESVVAMLACARAGLTHTVVFGGFSSSALQDRKNDAGAKAVLTADFGWRKGTKLGLREQVVHALEGAPTVETVITLSRDEVGATQTKKTADSTGKIGKASEYDWYGVSYASSKGEMEKLGGAEACEAEHPLFILYTSGTTGKQKGVGTPTGGYDPGGDRVDIRKKGFGKLV